MTEPGCAETAEQNDRIRYLKTPREIPFSIVTSAVSVLFPDSLLGVAILRPMRKYDIESLKLRLASKISLNISEDRKILVSLELGAQIFPLAPNSYLALAPPTSAVL